MEEVADVERVKYNSVKSKLEETRKRLGIHTMPHLIALAIRAGLIRAPASVDRQLRNIAQNPHQRIHRAHLCVHSDLPAPPIELFRYQSDDAGNPDGFRPRLSVLRGTPKRLPKFER